MTVAIAFLIETTPSPNGRDQQIAAKGLSTPQDAIAILLHRLVRPALPSSGTIYESGRRYRPQRTHRRLMPQRFSHRPNSHTTRRTFHPPTAMAQHARYGLHQK
jgi:hypothetical protein